MSRKKKYLQKSQSLIPLNNLPRETSLEDITLLQAKLEIEKSQLIQKGLTSSDPWDIIKTQKFLQGQSKSEDGMLKSFLINPDLTSLNTNNYRVPNKGVSYETLKRMSRTPIIRTIIGTRVDQVAGFAEPSDNEQTKGWMVRKKKTILNSKDKTEPTKEELKKIEYMTKFVQSGGTSDNKWSFESLEEYIRQITNDSLTIDQINMECVSNKKGELVMFYPVDASTIQLVDDSREEYLAQYFKKIQGYYPKYVQVWQGQVFTAYYPWEMTFGVRNKVTDINSNGYGISELEDMINIVTWLLYGMQYNGNFFSQGSNPKGFFTVEGNVSPNSLNDFKQMWRNTISGVQNCLDGSTYVWTEEGQYRLDELIKEDRVEGLRVWDGETYCDAIGYRTDTKRKVTTTLNNGMTVSTSPDHKFLTIRDHQPTMIRREDLTLDDYVVVNKKVLPTTTGVVIYKEQIVSDDLWEVIGWIIGDGYIGSGEVYSTGPIGDINLFYHYKKEQNLLERHFEVLQKYGVNCQKKIYTYTEEEKISLKRRYNFKSISDFYPYIQLIDKDFYRLLVTTLNFTTSKQKKNIAPVLFSLAEGSRCSFLRGFFSADGTVEHGRHVNLTCCNDKLREQTRLLLLSVGIRTTGYDGCYSDEFGENKWRGQIFIKDNDLFHSKVGLLQLHKQKTSTPKKHFSHNQFPQESIAYYCKLIREFNKTSKKLTIRQRDDLNNIICGSDHATLQRLINFAEVSGYKLPEFMYLYNFEKVTSLEDTGLDVEMYDIEMLDKKHQFVGNGMILSNSHKIPVIEASSKINWVDMQTTNKDMEFDLWMEFLMVVTCSLFKIDPSECGYQLQKSSQIFGQDGQKERLQHSQSKGLVPILRLLQRIFTKYIVERLDEDYEFVFTGVETEDQQQTLKMDVDKVSNGFMSMEDGFKKWSGRDFDPKKDTVLSQVYMQMAQMKQMGGAGMNEMVDEQNGVPSENPFEQKPEDQDSFQKSLDSYIEKVFKPKINESR